MAKHKICIDLGTANTLLWADTSSSIIFNEPTVIALDNQKREVVEIGYLAHKMIGRTPYNVDVIYPLKDGVIADLDATIKFIEQAFINLRLKKIIRGSSIYLATPSDVTPVEQQAIISLAMKLGAKKVYVDAEVKMAALGTGIDIYSPQGSLVLDIGGGTTDVGLIALGEIVTTKASHIAGNKFTAAIIKYLRQQHHLVIGEKTAEYIKMKIGSVSLTNSNQLLNVNGRDQVSGLPHTIIVSEKEISNCLIPLAEQLVDLVVETLEEAPAELTSDIATSGLILCGGGSLLSGLREFFSNKLGIPVHLASYPLEAVINGLIETATRTPIVEKEKER